VTNHQVTTAELLRPDVELDVPRRCHWWSSQKHCWHLDWQSEVCTGRQCCYCGREERSWLVPADHGPFKPSNSGEDVAMIWSEWERHSDCR